MRACAPAAAAMLLALASAGCSTYADPGGKGAPASEAASALARSRLPAFEPGVRRDEVVDRLADWPAGHRFSADGAHPEGWEWSGPDGVRVEAYFDGPVARTVRVSRTWGAGAPPVDGRGLPDGFVGSTREALESGIGAGLLVDRFWVLDSFGAGDLVVETYRWAIHDRELDTGLFLTVTVRGGVVAAVNHRWSHR